MFHSDIYQYKISSLNQLGSLACVITIHVRIRFLVIRSQCMPINYIIYIIYFNLYRLEQFAYGTTCIQHAYMVAYIYEVYILRVLIGVFLNNVLITQ